MKNTRWRRFVEKAGGAALFTGAVLLPAGALSVELSVSLCAKFCGFSPLATPWHTAMVSVSCASLLLLWLAVSQRVRVAAGWLRAVAVWHGMALAFCALFAFLMANYILAVVPLRALWVILPLSLIPPLTLAHTPLLALISGTALFLRFSRMAERQGAPVHKSLSIGIAVGLVATVAFFATGVDSRMVEDLLPKPSWQNDATPFGELYAKAEQGDGEASFRVALHYATGDGVGRDIGEAVGWHAKAYRQGYSASCCFLGRHPRGCGPDLPDGAPLCKRIVYRGDVRFQAHQGILYVTRDTAKAAGWFRKAARRGHPQAQLLLDRYDRDGSITLSDLQEVRQIMQTLILQHEGSEADERTE